MLVCVFCNYLRTSSSSAGVCWVDPFRASTRFSVSKCEGLKCLPPLAMWAIFVWSLGSVFQGLKCLPLIVGVWLFTWGLKCLPPFAGIELDSWSLKCLPPFMGIWLFTWGLKCLPPFTDVWLFSGSGISFHISYPVVVVDVPSINSSHVIIKHSGRS